MSYYGHTSRKYGCGNCSCCYEHEELLPPEGEAVIGVHAGADYTFEALFPTFEGPVMFSFIDPAKTLRLSDWIQGANTEPPISGHQDYVWSVTFPSTETEKLIENGVLLPSLNRGTSLTPEYKVCVRAQIEGNSTPVDFSLDVQIAIL